MKKKIKESNDELEFVCKDCTDERITATQKALKENRISFMPGDLVKVRMTDGKRFENIWGIIIKMPKVGKQAWIQLKNYPEILPLKFNDKVKANLYTCTGLVRQSSCAFIVVSPCHLRDLVVNYTNVDIEELKRMKK